MKIDPQYDELVTALRQALVASTQASPRDAITTEAAVREGNVMNGLLTTLPEQVRPVVRLVIAQFDAESVPVPVWDIERITPASSPKLHGFANYRAPEGDMTLSSPLFRGRFSKFRIGMQMDGTFVGVKQMRSDRNAPPDQTRRPTQHPLMMLPMPMIVREVIMMNTLTQALRPMRVLRRDNDVYVVMPLMRCTLQDVHTAGAAPPLGAGRHVGARVAESLRRIHAPGFLHGDVKLDNVLWNEEGSLELCDFAMSMKLTTPKLPGAQRGTPQTSAPEIVAAQPFDARCDVWSLGIALLQMHATSQELNPFMLLNALDGGARWRHAETQHAAYAQWRQRLTAQGPLGEASLGQAAADGTAFGAFVRGCTAADAQLAVFVVQRMLDPDPQSRATIGEVADAMGVLAQTHSRPWPFSAPKDKAREQALAGLRQLRGMG